MKYFIILNGQQTGPFEVNELYNKGITPETLVWTEGMENWTPAWQVGDLKQVINSSIVMSEPPKYEPNGPGTSKQATPPPYDGHQPRQKRRGCGTRSLVALLIMVVIAVAMIFTCPDKRAHQEVIRQEFNSAMSQKMGESKGIVQSMIQMGSKYVMGLAAESALNELLTVDNYFVCSVGKMEYEGRNHVASIGVLGHVFTVNKDDIVRALDKLEQAAREEQQRLEGDGSGESLVRDIIDVVKELF